MGYKISVIFCRQSEVVRSGAKTVPSGLSLPEIMPEYMVWIGADRFKQPQIGFRGGGCKRREVHRQEATSSEPHQKAL